MRVKFTTTLDPEVIKMLKKQAIDEDLNVNDLIERYANKQAADAIIKNLADKKGM